MQAPSDLQNLSGLTTNKLIQNQLSDFEVKNISNGYQKNDTQQNLSHYEASSMNKIVQPLDQIKSLKSNVLNQNHSSESFNNHLFSSNPINNQVYSSSNNESPMSGSTNSFQHSQVNNNFPNNYSQTSTYLDKPQTGNSITPEDRSHLQNNIDPLSLPLNLNALPSSSPENNLDQKSSTQMPSVLNQSPTTSNSYQTPLITPSVQCSASSQLKSKHVEAPVDSLAPTASFIPDPKTIAHLALSQDLTVPYSSLPSQGHQVSSTSTNVISPLPTLSLGNSKSSSFSNSGFIPPVSNNGMPSVSCSRRNDNPHMTSEIPPVANNGPLFKNELYTSVSTGSCPMPSRGISPLNSGNLSLQNTRLTGSMSSTGLPPLSSSKVLPMSSSVMASYSNNGVPPISSSEMASYSNSGVPPIPSSEITPYTSSGVPQISSSGVPSSSSSGVPPIPSSEMTPFSSSRVPSIASSGIPSSSSGVLSISNSGMSPYSSTGAQLSSSSGIPSLSNSEMPLLNSGMPCYSSSQIPPLSSSGMPSYSSSGIPLLSSSGMPSLSNIEMPPYSSKGIPSLLNSGMPVSSTGVHSLPNNGGLLLNSEIPSSLPLMSVNSSMSQSLASSSRVAHLMKNRYPAISSGPNIQQSNFRMPPSSTVGVSSTFPNTNQSSPICTNDLYTQAHTSRPSFPNSSYNNYQMPSDYQIKQSHYSGSTYTQQNQQSPGITNQFANMSIHQGLNRMWGYEAHDLLNARNILPCTRVESPPIRLPQELAESSNCSPELFRCTLTKIPISKNLLDKSRLPLGVLIHPFKDINQLKVIKNVIVRCRSCRAYINPFVQFIDNKVWKCNLCFRANDIHEQFLYDRNTEMYGDPYRRPEVQSATVEYLASAEYNVRDPPQPAMYVFLLDVSQIASQSNYLSTVCEVLLNHLKQMPGDLRKSVGIITYDSFVHFYSLSEGQTQPTQLIITDIDDIFLPSPENIMVNVNECFDVLEDLLKQLPDKFKETYDNGSALGAALQAAYKLLKPTGGRVTVFQTCLPNIGPGALTPRENPNQRSNDDPPHMKPATDFYKKLALECMPCQIAIDLFILNSQYVDLGTLAGISQFSSGCMHHIPLYSGRNMSHVYHLERMFTRYLVRKIGFESVMRIRCTQGLAIHSFHGNFFIRSPDLLALPNVNPDAGFGMQITINDTLTHIPYVCFQAAVLYTSSKGDRRIRVHTLCLPVVSNVNDVFVGADQQCIAGLLAKMAVDRSLQYSLTDAREAFLNVVCDILATYKASQPGHATGSLLAPSSLKLLPLYILALLKHPAFRIGQSTRLDDRLFAMCEMKCLPLSNLMLSIYPELYPVHTLDQDATFEWSDLTVPSPQILQLSAERLQVSGTYLLNTPDSIIILVRHGTSPQVCSGFFGFQQVSQMPETMYELPQLETSLSIKLQSFIAYLNDEKAYYSPVKIIKDSSPDRMEFYDKLIEDKNAAGMSYYEFLQRIREMVK